MANQFSPIWEKLKQKMKDLVENSESSDEAKWRGIESDNSNSAETPGRKLYSDLQITIYSISSKNGSY